MHGIENYDYFVNGLGEDEDTIGENISLIHEVRFLSFPRSLTDVTVSCRPFAMAKCSEWSANYLHEWSHC
jgi:hypothetical protein